MALNLPNEAQERRRIWFARVFALVVVFSFVFGAFAVMFGN